MRSSYLSYGEKTRHFFFCVVRTLDQGLCVAGKKLSFAQRGPYWLFIYLFLFARIDRGSTTLLLSVLLVFRSSVFKYVGSFPIKSEKRQ